MSKKIKRPSAAFIFTLLVLILSFMILDFISLPTYGKVSVAVMCGTVDCLCYCVDRNGGCVCKVTNLVGCTCWCPNGNEDECFVDDDDGET